MIVSFYYKPKNTYPERVYVLYGEWRKRNKRAMGVSTRLPFFSRETTPRENKALADASRLHYWQYEDLQILLNDEARFQSQSSISQFKDALAQELKSARSSELLLQLPILSLPRCRRHTQAAPSMLRRSMRAYGQCRIVFRLSKRKTRESA